MKHKVTREQRLSVLFVAHASAADGAEERGGSGGEITGAEETGKRRRWRQNWHGRKWSRDKSDGCRPGGEMRGETSDGITQRVCEGRDSLSSCRRLRPRRVYTGWIFLGRWRVIEISVYADVCVCSCPSAAHTHWSGSVLHLF